jgi:hypothetical protein
MVVVARTFHSPMTASVAKENEDAAFEQGSDPPTALAISGVATAQDVEPPAKPTIVPVHSTFDGAFHAAMVSHPARGRLARRGGGIADRSRLVPREPHHP